MSQYLIDTDWLIQILHGDTDSAQTIEDLAPDGLATSLITYGELYHGAYYARDPQQALEAMQDVLAEIEMLQLTPAIMERYAIIRGQLTRNQRQQVGDMDLLIAATALEHDLTLVTYNRRDYDLVAGLTLYKP
jgi:predicted nucleic acid-binding protein